MQVSWEVGGTLGGDFRGADLWTHHRSDGEHPCIVSILVVPSLVTVLTGDTENVWMYQMPKTFRGFPRMHVGLHLSVTMLMSSSHPGLQAP